MELDYTVTLTKTANKAELLSAFEIDSTSENHIDSNIIPDRTIYMPISGKQDWNKRTFHIKLESEEVDKLKNHPDVIDIEPPLQFDDSWIDTTQSLQYIRYQKSFVLDRDNWGLIRHSRPTLDDVSTGVLSAGDTLSAVDYVYEYDGSGVDLVIQDAGVVDWDQDEFTDSNGNSRFVPYNWAQNFPTDVRVANIYSNNNFPEVYNVKNYISTHATQCASIAGGKRFGWAKGAAIYSLPMNVVKSAYYQDAIRLFHEAKVAAGNTRPTVVSASWGPKGYAKFINAINFRGNYVTDLSCFSAYQAYEFDGRNRNDGTKNYKYGVLGDMSGRFNVYSSFLAAETDQLTDAGVFYIKSAGNQSQKLDVPGGLDYNNFLRGSNNANSSVVLKGNIMYFNRGAGNISHDTIVVGNIDTIVQPTSGLSSTDPRETIAYSSDKGPRVDTNAAGTHIQCADISLETQDFYIEEGLKSSRTSNGIVSKTGTSFSTPQVAGMTAVALSRTGWTLSAITPGKMRKYWKDVSTSTNSLSDNSRTAVTSPAYITGEPAGDFFANKQGVFGSTSVPFLNTRSGTDPSTVTALSAPSNTDPTDTGILISNNSFDYTKTAFKHKPTQAYRYYKFVQYNDLARTEFGDKFLTKIELGYEGGKNVLDNFPSNPNPNDINWTYLGSNIYKYTMVNWEGYTISIQGDMPTIKNSSGPSIGDYGFSITNAFDGSTGFFTMPRKFGYYFPDSSVDFQTDGPPSTEADVAITVDAGREVLIDTVRYTHPGAAVLTPPTLIDVLASNNGTDWTRIANIVYPTAQQDMGFSGAINPIEGITDNTYLQDNSTFVANRTQPLSIDSGSNASVINVTPGEGITNPNPSEDPPEETTVTGISGERSVDPNDPSEIQNTEIADEIFFPAKPQFTIEGEFLSEFTDPASKATKEIVPSLIQNYSKKRKLNLVTNQFDLIKGDIMMKICNTVDLLLAVKLGLRNLSDLELEDLVKGGFDNLAAGLDDFFEDFEELGDELALQSLNVQRELVLEIQNIRAQLETAFEIVNLNANPLGTIFDSILNLPNKIIRELSLSPEKLEEYCAQQAGISIQALINKAMNQKSIFGLSRNQESILNKHKDLLNKDNLTEFDNDSPYY